MTSHDDAGDEQMQVGAVTGVQPSCPACGPAFQPITAPDPVAAVEPVPWQLDVQAPDPAAPVPASPATSGVELLGSAPVPLDAYMASISLGVNGTGQGAMYFRPRHRTTD